MTIQVDTTTLEQQEQVIKTECGQDTTTSLEKILDTLTRTYAVSRKEFRDTQIEVGLAVQEYLVGRAALADTVQRYERTKKGYSREEVVRYVAERLGVTRDKVLSLVRNAVTAELLSGGTLDCGKMTYRCLVLLGKYVRRRVDKGWVGAGKSHGVATATLTDREQWEVNTAYGDQGKQMFSRAAAGEVTYNDLTRLTPESAKGQRSGTKNQQRQHPVIYTSPRARELSNDTFGAVKESDPRDVVDMVLGLIAKSKDPERVKALLAEQLLRSAVSSP